MRDRIGRLAIALVVVLCIVSLGLLFSLPSDSLVVDLIYQGF
jgi:hypothetical protein